MKGMEEYLNVREVNLSCNQIEKIEGVSQLAGLVSLDLSSNRLTRVEGLQNNKHLATLSLAQNRITTFSNLSFNLQLQTLDISGNRATHQDHLRCLFSLKNLTHLTIHHSPSQTNPLVTHAYPHLLQSLKQKCHSLDTLDSQHIHDYHLQLPSNDNLPP